MKQQTFSDMEYANRKRTSRREEFLDAMEGMVPWEKWISMILILPIPKHVTKP